MRNKNETSGQATKKRKKAKKYAKQKELMGLVDQAWVQENHWQCDFKDILGTAQGNSKSLVMILTAFQKSFKNSGEKNVRWNFVKGKTQQEILK